MNVYEKWKQHYLGETARFYGAWGIPFHELLRMNENHLTQLYDGWEKTPEEEIEWAQIKAARVK